jgi:hypothetical protein
MDAGEDHLVENNAFKLLLLQKLIDVWVNGLSI